MNGWLNKQLSEINCRISTMGLQRWQVERICQADEVFREEYESLLGRLFSIEFDITRDPWRLALYVDFLETKTQYLALIRGRLAIRTAA